MPEEEKSKTSDHQPLAPASKNKAEDSDEDSTDGEDEETDRKDIVCPPDVKAGNCKLVFGHPEAFLSGNGRKLLRSPVYQRRVVTCVIDETHCVMEW